MSIKTTHETETCRRFLSSYNHVGKKLDFLKQGKAADKEPDCICSNGIAIELVGIYDNEYQAEKIWSSARKKIIHKQQKILLLTLDNLQNEIGNKLQKLNKGNYGGFVGKIILVCNLHSPLLQDREVKNYIESYVPFHRDGFFDRYFHEIWVSWKSEVSGEWRTEKLE